MVHRVADDVSVFNSRKFTVPAAASEPQGQPFQRPQRPFHCQRLVRRPPALFTASPWFADRLRRALGDRSDGFKFGCDVIWPGGGSWDSLLLCGAAPGDGRPRTRPRPESADRGPGLGGEDNRTPARPAARAPIRPGAGPAARRWRSGCRARIGSESGCGPPRYRIPRDRATAAASARARIFTAGAPFRRRAAANARHQEALDRRGPAAPISRATLNGRQ